MDGPAGGRGKWSRRGVPHKGWSCVEIEDLGSADETCEMCEAQSIRFVHHMAHDLYGETLRCGCVCAGHMEEDLLGAQLRDKAMRNRSARRKTFPDLQRWKTSAKGNPVLNIDGFRVTVFQRDGGFKAVVSRQWPKSEAWTRRPLPDIRSAKFAAFDLLSMLSERLKTERQPIQPPPWLGGL